MTASYAVCHDLCLLICNNTINLNNLHELIQDSVSKEDEGTNQVFYSNSGLL